MDKENHLRYCWDTESDAATSSSEERGREAMEFIEACMDIPAARADETTGRGRGVARPSHAVRLEEIVASVNEKTAGNNYEGMGEVELGFTEHHADGSIPSRTVGLGLRLGAGGDGPAQNSEWEKSGPDFKKGNGPTLPVQTGGLSGREMSLGGSGSSEEVGTANGAQEADSLADNGLSQFKSFEPSRENNLGLEENVRASPEISVEGEAKDQDEGGERQTTRGSETWAFGKELGLRACAGEDRVVQALELIGGGNGGRGVGTCGLQ